MVYNGSRHPGRIYCPKGQHRLSRGRLGNPVTIKRLDVGWWLFERTRIYTKFLV